MDNTYEHVFKIKLGSVVKDVATGFEGTVMARINYLTGCDQYSVQPPVKEDGTWVDSKWFDDARLQIVKEPSEEGAEAQKEIVEHVKKNTKEPGADIAPPTHKN